MSKSTNRNVKKKLTKEELPKTKIPLPSEEETSRKKKNTAEDNKKKLTDDLLHDRTVTQFILEEDVLNLFPLSGNSSRTESQSSFTDDLEERSTKQISAEYDLVERILYSEEKYKNYNQEFDQWTNNFKYLRITGNGIRIPKNWKKPKTFYEQEIIAEHRDPIDILSPEVAFYKEIKSIIKETVINNILEDVNKSKKKNNQRNQKWRKRDKTPIKSTEKLSLLPISTKVHNSTKQHPIIRSDISSAKWQKPKEDPFNFPVITSDNLRNSSKSGKLYPSPKTNLHEDKVFSLPPIKSLAFQPDHQNKGFFLRSNSCNTYSQEPTRKKSSFRFSSSKVDS